MWNPALEARPQHIISRYGANREERVCVVAFPPAEQVRGGDAASNLLEPGIQSPVVPPEASSLPADALSRRIRYDSQEPGENESQPPALQSGAHPIAAAVGSNLDADTA